MLQKSLIDMIELAKVSKELSECQQENLSSMSAGSVPLIGESTSKLQGYPGSPLHRYAPMMYQASGIAHPNRMSFGIPQYGGIGTFGNSPAARSSFSQFRQNDSFSSESKASAEPVRPPAASDFYQGLALNFSSTSPSATETAVTHIRSRSTAQSESWGEDGIPEVPLRGTQLS